MRNNNNTTSPFRRLCCLVLAMAALTVLPNVSSNENITGTHTTTQPHRPTLPNKGRGILESTSISARKIYRLSTSIQADKTDKSIRLRSIDAGSVPLYPSYSGCINCGVIDIPHHLDYGYNIQAITGGIIGGTIARKINRHFEPDHQFRMTQPLSLPNDNTLNIDQPLLPE